MAARLAVQVGAWPYHGQAYDGRSVPGVANCPSSNPAMNTTRRMEIAFISSVVHRSGLRVKNRCRSETGSNLTGYQGRAQDTLSGERRAFRFANRWRERCRLHLSMRLRCCLRSLQSSQSPFLWSLFAGSLAHRRHRRTPFGDRFLRGVSGIVEKTSPQRPHWYIFSPTNGAYSFTACRRPRIRARARSAFWS